MPNPFYTYILNIYDLVWFYGISTIVGYLMPNPVYSYILDIYNFLNLNKFNKTSNMFTQLNDQNVLFQTIQFSISQSQMVPSIAMYH